LIIREELYIIAEAGVNHNGSLQTAFELIEAACDAGADCIKFQAFSADELVIKKEESQYDMLSKLELSEEDLYYISIYCKYKQIDFLVTPFSTRWVRVLYYMGVNGFKISSGSITHLELLKEVGRTKLPVILSTGMSNVDDIKKAVSALTDNGCVHLAILHCISLYPTPVDKINLFAMNVLKKEFFDIYVGLSDHTTDVSMGGLAVAAGAEIIEKHFTLDKDMEGPDHRMSLSPGELKIYIEEARRVEKICGCEDKEMLPEEEKIKEMVRCSLVAKMFIPKRSYITEEMLTEKRPATGISPMDINNVVGKITTKNIEKDEVLKYEYLSE